MKNQLKGVGTVIKRAEFEFNLSGFNTKSCCVIVPGIDASCAVIIMIYIKENGVLHICRGYLQQL